MEKYYYIQKGSDPAKDIWSDYGIYVSKTSGLNQMPAIKKPFFRSWPDEQGDDVFLPINTQFESKKITITFTIIKSTVSDVKSTIRSFLNYLLSGGDFSYFDTFKKEGFRGYYDQSKLITETYRETLNMIEFDLDFIAPNGICWGFDNSDQNSIFVNMINGTADLYFSTGASVIYNTESLIVNQSGGFIIVCPSIFGGVEIEERVSKVLGIAGKVLGINGKVLGI